MARLTYLDNGKWTIHILGTECRGAWVDRLASYEETGLEPEDIAEAVALFPVTDIPKELKSWVERCTWHVRKCNELSMELQALKEDIGRLQHGTDIGKSPLTNEHVFFIPQYEDWNLLLNVVGEEDEVIHWGQVHSWVDASVATRDAFKLSHAQRALRGCDSARFMDYGYSSSDYSDCGFRPALKPLSTDNAKPSDKLWRYALYLNGVEQLIPTDPSIRKDIPAFKPDQRIEFKEATCPESTITWLYNGRCYVADRMLLRKVSFDELEKQGFLEANT